MKSFRIGLMVVAAMLGGIGLAQAQTLKVGKNHIGERVPFQTAVFLAVAKDAGLQFDFQDMLFADLMPSLVGKKIDIIAAQFTPTPERELLVDFSQSYGSYRDMAVLPIGDIRSYKAIVDFKGLTVAGTKGATYVDKLKKAGANVIEMDSEMASMIEVEAGRAAAAIALSPNVGFYAPSHPNLKFVDSYPPMTVSNAALAVQKGNTVLLAKLNASLTKLKADGTVAKLAKDTGFPYP